MNVSNSIKEEGSPKMSVGRRFIGYLPPPATLATIYISFLCSSLIRRTIGQIPYSLNFQICFVYFVPWVKEAVWKVLNIHRLSCGERNC